MKPKTIRTPKDKLINYISLSSTEALAVAYSRYPAILLDRDVTVIDVSESFRSCYSKSVDRTVLLDSMSRDVFKKLEAFCTSSPFSHTNNTENESFPLKLGRFRFGFAVKLPFFSENSTALFLAVREAEYDLLYDLICSRFPKELLDIFRREALISGNALYRSVLTLFDKSDEFDVSEAAIHLKYVSERISRVSPTVSSSIRVITNESVARTHSHGLNPGAYTLIFTSLVHVADSISEGSDITVRLSLEYGSLQVDMSCTLPENVSFFGKSEDVSALSSVFRNLSEYFILAECCANEFGMYVRANFTGGVMNFTFGTSNHREPVLEFKFRDAEKRSASLLDAANTLFSVLRLPPEQEAPQAEG